MYHDKGDTLDLVITRHDEAGLISNIKVCPFHLSDHHAISFHLPFRRPANEIKKTKVRNMKELDTEELSKEISKSELILDPPSDLDSLVSCYNETLSTIFSKHAPVTEKEIVLHVNAPWYNNSIKQAKQERRRAERKWTKSKLTIDKEILKRSQKIVTDLCTKAKIEYYTTSIDAPGNDSKKLFSLPSNLLYKSKDSLLPSHSSENHLADTFGKYFFDKCEH